MPNMPQPGAEWAGYRIDEQIGLGGRGQVYVAFDALLRKPVAIKALADMPSDDPVGERFCRVPVAAAELGHDGIMRVHNTSDVDGVAFVVMDWYPAGSLADQIAVSILTVHRARAVLGLVADALDTAHQHGIIHCNVKPTNILMHEDGRRVVVTDFGSTRFADEARSDRAVPTDERARLPYYEAPEVLLGEPASPAADVYSLGAVLYTALSGRVPFPGDVPRQITEAHLGAPVPAITALRDDLPADFDALIAAAMAKDPARRPASGRAFIAGLDEAIAAPFPEPEADRPDEPGVAVASERALGDEALVFTAPADAPGEHPVPLHVPDRSSVYRGARQAKRDGSDWRLPDGSVDGAILGVYEDEPRSRWLTVVVAVVLLVGLALVGWLVWRAMEADSDRSVNSEAVAPTVLVST